MHLDRFSRFAWFTIMTVTDRPTDKQTDHATPSVAIGRIYTVMRPNNHNNNNQA